MKNFNQFLTEELTNERYIKFEFKHNSIYIYSSNNLIDNISKPIPKEFDKKINDFIFKSAKKSEDFNEDEYSELLRKKYDDVEEYKKKISDEYTKKYIKVIEAYNSIVTSMEHLMLEELENFVDTYES